MDACANGLPLKRVASRVAGVHHATLHTSSSFWRAAILFAGMLGCGFLSSCEVPCVAAGKTSSARETETAIAVRFDGRIDAEGFPVEDAWKNAPAVAFHSDWQGKNADLPLETEVRLLWSRDALYVRFLAHFRDITVFADAEPSGRRDRLWERDVAEVFLQPAGSDGLHYKEFEVSPNGFWIELDIAPGVKHDLKSGLKRRANIDEKRNIWTAELALPMISLTEHFDPANTWRVNFFRVEGASEPRFYSAWRPTGTPAPNFHVPDAFGKLEFEK
jgi:alpha-galactosidase